MNWQHWNFFSLHSSDGIVLFAFELRNLSNFQDFYFDALFCGLNECSNSIWSWPGFCVIMPPAMMVIMLPTSTCQRAGYPTHVQTSILNGYYIRISVKFILLCTCTLTPFKCGAFGRYSKFSIRNDCGWWIFAWEPVHLRIVEAQEHWWKVSLNLNSAKWFDHLNYTKAVPRQYNSLPPKKACRILVELKNEIHSNAFIRVECVCIDGDRDDIVSVGKRTAIDTHASHHELPKYNHLFIWTRKLNLLQ